MRFVRSIPDAATTLAERAREEGWDHLQFLAEVLAVETTARESRGGQARVRAARFSQVKTLDDFDFTHQRSVDRTLISHLAQLDFLIEKKNVILLGPPRTGKTHLSIALGVQVARRGLRVLFATAHEATLPNALATLVGERGVRLSGGQRQRVAVGRALYREPPIIILDEGTSALDTATESALIRALYKIAPDRTLVAVAHRISTLRDADGIVVLEAGRITAEGTYDELLATSATFRTLDGVEG